MMEIKFRYKNASFPSEKCEKSETPYVSDTKDHV